MTDPRIPGTANLNNFGKPIVNDPSLAENTGTPTATPTNIVISELVTDVNTLKATTVPAVAGRVTTLETTVAPIPAAITALEGRVAAAVAAEETADGTTAETTQALANALKTKVNAILAALKAAGLMEAGV
jgi:hypothetical protein